jgi:hypothetical protein
MALVSGSSYGSIALELNGQAAGWLRRVQPPGYEVSQVVAETGASVLAKSGGRVALTPVDADFVFAGPGPLLDWALTLPRKSPVTTDGAIQLLDRNFRLLRRIEWSQGLLTELRLPELDATSKSPFALGLTWLPESLRYSKASFDAGAYRPGKSKALQLSNFRVTGLPFDTSAVVRVALPTVRTKMAAAPIGMQRLPQRHYASVDLGEVRLEIGARSADAARDWVVKVIGDGTVTDAEQVDFSIELLDASMKNVAATITLRGCSLTGYAEFELTAAAEKPANVALRFSVGGLDIKALA